MNGSEEAVNCSDKVHANHNIANGHDIIHHELFTTRGRNNVKLIKLDDSGSSVGINNTGSVRFVLGKSHVYIGIRFNEEFDCWDILSTSTNRTKIDLRLDAGDKSITIDKKYKVIFINENDYNSIRNELYNTGFMLQHIQEKEY